VERKTPNSGELTSDCGEPQAGTPALLFPIIHPIYFQPTARPLFAEFDAHNYRAAIAGPLASRPSAPASLRGRELAAKRTVLNRRSIQLESQIDAADPQPGHLCNRVLHDCRGATFFAFRERRKHELFPEFFMWHECLIWRSSLSETTDCVASLSCLRNDLGCWSFLSPKSALNLITTLPVQACCNQKCRT
jgi:hypothetical protein